MGTVIPILQNHGEEQMNECVTQILELENGKGEGLVSFPFSHYLRTMDGGPDTGRNCTNLCPIPWFQFPKPRHYLPNTLVISGSWIGSRATGAGTQSPKCDAVLHREA